jgi:hypothetical protein
MKPKKITLKQARRALEVVDAGLCHGKGEPIPGKMCVEAAVTFALGEPFSDEPSCVAPSVRAFKIALNDSAWTDNAARTAGMRKLAIAQLGTKDQLDEVKFVQELAFQTIKQIVPISLRCAASVCFNPDHKKALEKAAIACESALDLSDAKYAAKYADYVAESADYVAESAEYAAKSAKSAAKSAEYVAESAEYVAESAEYAAKSAKSAAKSAEYAAKSAEYAAESAEYVAESAAEYNKPNYFLKLLAEIGVQALRVAGAAGIKLMDKIC